MPTINIETLLRSIQAVAARVQTLEAEMSDEDEEMVADTAELLTSYDSAADDLRRAYDEEARSAINLPPYDELASG